MFRIRRSFPARAMAVAASAVIVGFAALVGPVSAADAEPTFQFDIPAEPLSQALTDFSQASSKQIIFSAEFTKERKAHGLHGRYTAEQALDALLAGTDLKAEKNSAGVLMVRPKNLLAAQTEGAAAPRRTDSTASSEENSRNERSSEAEPLQEIVVTAQKRDERLRDVPISIAVLGGNDLDQSTSTGVSEALGFVPGVATTMGLQGGGTQVSIRGITAGGPNFEGSSPIGYYLDGVPFGLIKSAIVPDESAYDLQRIEVLRGPQGTLYGASALNGVVRVLTKDADLSNFDFKARASDSYTDGGSNNYRGDMAVNVPIMPGLLAARAVVGYENDGGWIDTPNRSDVNSAQLRNYRLKVNSQPSDDLSIGFSVWHSPNSYGAPSIGDAHERNSSLGDQAISTKFDTYGLKIGYQLPGISIASTTSYLYYEDGGNLDLVPLIGNALGPYSLFTGETSHVFSEELNVNSSREGPWRWSAGGIYRHATEDLTQYRVQTPAADLYDDTSRSYAVFGELTRLFLDGGLELTAGLRQFEDHVSQQDQLGPSTSWIPAEASFHATTPRAVLTWHPADSSIVYGSYSQGFRSGFPQNANVPVTAGFGPLKADRLDNYEAGTKGNLLDNRVSYDAAVYYMFWRNIQENFTTTFQGLPVTALVNGQSASGTGVDLGVTAKPLKDLTVGVNVSENNLGMDSAVIQGGVHLFSKGERPDLSPKYTAGASAEYVVPFGESGFIGRLSASGNYTSIQTYRSISGGTNFIGRGDRILITRASFSVDAPSGWTARLFVDNLNNDRGSPVRGLYLVPVWDLRERPRTAGAQVEYHFR